MGASMTQMKRSGSFPLYSIYGNYFIMKPFLQIVMFKETFQWISIYPPLCSTLTFYCFITSLSILSIPQSSHLFLIHFKGNCFPLKTVLWISFRVQYCLKYFFILRWNLYAMKCKIAHVHLLNFDKCIHLYTSNPY